MWRWFVFGLPLNFALGYLGAACLAVLAGFALEGGAVLFGFKPTFMGDPEYGWHMLPRWAGLALFAVAIGVGGADRVGARERFQGVVCAQDQAAAALR